MVKDIDPERFVQMIESRGLRILIDRYNHVVVLGRLGELICMMFVSFHAFAAWLPDGTVFGDRRLIGGEPTPGRWRADRGRAQTGGGRGWGSVMTIQVPFQLRRRSRTEPAEALLIPSRDPRVLVAFCSRLGLDPRGRVFDIAGGFLLELERPAIDPMPGAVRLRSVATALYLPVDAELIPSLLDDEASGLVRDWGVVFSPCGGPLLFDRHAPIDMNEILKAQPRTAPELEFASRSPSDRGSPCGDRIRAT